MRRKSLACLFLLTVAQVLVAQSHPVPLIYQPLQPTSVAPGHAAFTLSVEGTGFVPGAVVKWNGKSLSTTFVSTGLLQSSVSASAVARASTASIAVANPGTIVSNVIYFPVRQPSTTVNMQGSTIEAGEIAVGDFNNDGRPDIAVQGLDQNVDTYLDEKGGFMRLAGPAWGGSGVLPAPLDVTGDFNGDGNLDVFVCFSAAGPSSGCVLYLGDGKGGFAPIPGYHVLQGSGAVADVNGDGRLDYVFDNVAADGLGSSFGVDLGHGDGLFQNSQGIPLNGNKPGGTPVVADFNLDGFLDVAVPVANYVAVFLRSADGASWQHEVDYPVANPGALAVADVNGDGILDLVTSGVSILLGKGDGTFSAGNSISLTNGGTGANIQVGDLNGDGILDLVTATMDSNYNQTVNILLGMGGGSFQNPITLPTEQAWWFPEVQIADFNDDGKLDIVIGGQANVTVFRQQQ